MASTTQRNCSETYAQSQEIMVTKLLTQVGDGYTAARLRIALQHIHLIPPAPKAMVRLDGIF